MPPGRPDTGGQRGTRPGPAAGQGRLLPEAAAHPAAPRGGSSRSWDAGPPRPVDLGSDGDGHAALRLSGRWTQTGPTLSVPWASGRHSRPGTLGLGTTQARPSHVSVSLDTWLPRSTRWAALTERGRVSGNGLLTDGLPSLGGLRVRAPCGAGWGSRTQRCPGRRGLPDICSRVTSPPRRDGLLFTRSVRTHTRKYLPTSFSLVKGKLAFTWPPFCLFNTANAASEGSDVSVASCVSPSSWEVPRTPLSKALSCFSVSPRTTGHKFQKFREVEKTMLEKIFLGL